MQRVVAGLAVNQNQVRPHVTVPMVLPLAPKRMVPMPLFKRLIVCKRLDQRLKILKQKLAMWALRFAFEIPFESGSLLNLSH